tara:strand:+ start:472 stop:657 length:186 start_codon:yes stop_codon:yes gene_type:complete
MKTIMVLDIEKGTVSGWTLTEILDEINRDHSDEYIPYDESNWREGWEVWCEGEGYLKLVSN